MLLPYDIDRAKLLAEAKHLVRRAVQRGWMSYPLSITLNDEGTPINVVEEDYEVTSTSHTPELCRKAYSLRERGLTLEQVAMACGVARGSVAYIISKGHEMFLQHERNAKHPNTIATATTHKESLRQ
jgi:hypothetical protein